MMNATNQSDAYLQNPLNLVGSITVAPERVDIVLEKRK